MKLIWYILESDVYANIQGGLSQAGWEMTNAKLKQQNDKLPRCIGRLYIWSLNIPRLENYVRWIMRHIFYIKLNS